MQSELLCLHPAPHEALSAAAPHQAEVSTVFIESGSGSERS